MKRFFLYLLLIIIHLESHSQEKDIFQLARNGSLAELKEELKMDKNKVNKINKDGNSLLVLACYYQNEEVATFLINEVKDINFISPQGTALMATVVKKNCNITKLLLEKGANPNLFDKNGMTALMYACIFKMYDIANLLVKYKADTNIKDFRGKSAFDYSIALDDDKMIEILKTKN